MSADRSQPSNERPDQVQQSSGCFNDAETTAPTGPASPTPEAGSDSLFARLALITGFINQEPLDNAISQQQTDPAKSLADILVQTGSLSDKERRAIEVLCEKHAARHGGDPQRSLDSLTMAPTVSRRQPTAMDTVTYSPKSADGKQPQGTFGEYELLNEIARGGMGVVYKARQTRLNRLVALKMIKSGELADADQVRRFYAEAEAAAKLDHPHIVPVYEVGQINGQHFFSMAFVVGKSLNDSVKSGGPLPPQQGARLMKTVAETVQFAHEKGIVHRDIKPQNILLDEKDQPRVTDFGLAKQIESSSELTATGQIMGTPSYMPPEQAKGEIQQIGPMSDVYSLGATLYFLLTGRPPFQTASTAETIRQVIEAEPVAVRRLNPAVPRDLETICLKCLRKEPAKRYATAADLAADLGRWLENKPIVARPVGRGERAWLWCKRRPAVALLSAAVVIILVVGSLVAVEMRNAARATGIVDSLASADVAQVPQIVAELENHRGRVTPMLVALAGTEPKTVEERKVQLHSRLALVTHDEQQVHPLVEELLATNVSYVGVIRDQLAPYQERFQADLWNLLHDATKDSSRRFRAGLALATYVPASEQWTPADHAFLVEQLVAANPEHQPRLRDYLRPLVNRLLVDLERIFGDPKSTDAQRLSAANAFADYAGSDIPKLSQLLAVATPQQHAVLYPIVAATPAPSTFEDLGKIAATQPPADLGLVERVPFGQRRANAAVTLLRLGEREKVLPVFDVTDDAEALTQFIFRCRERGIDAEALLDCLQRVSDAPQDRYPRHARYSLLLALGEFLLDEIPASRREALLQQLADWYRQDPSSGVHGAAGWLLRKWGQTDVARKVDQTAMPYAPDREWFTLAITVTQTAPPKPPEKPAENNAATEPSAKPVESGEPAPPREETKPKTSPEPPKTFYYTFIVFPAGDYEIGSVNDEPDRVKIEGRHPVKLTRPYALLDREITIEELITYKPQYTGFMQQFDAKPADAGFAADWYDAVGFCRWLGQQSGLSEGDQSYAAPEALDKAQYPREPNPAANWAPRNWPLELGRRGFRLPTESEWEVASRSGVRTTYGIGSEVSLLGRFGWFTENSDKHVHPPRELRPSIRGLFDVHGNLFEWTHDWFGDYGVEVIIDPLGAKEGSTRVFRGGSWFNVAASCRAACRDPFDPAYRSGSLGFRVALSPSGVSPEAGSVKGAEPSGAGTEEASAEQRPEMP